MNFSVTRNTLSISDMCKCPAWRAMQDICLTA